MRNILYILLLLPLLSFGQGQQNDKYYNIATGTNSYTVTINAITASAPYDGQKIAVRFTNPNSGASTLVVISGNGTYAVKDIETSAGSALTTGFITANSAWYLIYNSSLNSWQILGGDNSGSSITVPIPTVDGGTNSTLSATDSTVLRGNGTAWVPSGFKISNTFPNKTIPFNKKANIIGWSNDFTYNDTSLVLGNQGSAITIPLWIWKSYAGEQQMRITNIASCASCEAQVVMESNGGGRFILRKLSNTFSTTGIFSPSANVIDASDGDLGLKTSTGYDILFASGGVDEDMRLNNSGQLRIGSSIIPFSAKLTVSAETGIVGQEISTDNTMALSIITGGGGIDITNTSGGSSGLNIYSDAGGITGQSVGDGIDWTAPEMVFKSNNSAVLTANNTTIANSFEDNQTIGAFTSTGNFFQIVSNNASTRPQFVINKQGTNHVFVTSTGLFGIGTGSVTPTARLQVTSTGSTSATYAVKINDSASDTLFHIRDDGALYFGDNGTNSTSGDGATINQPTGSFIKDNSGTTFTLTNSLITAKSKIFLQLASDLTATGHATSVAVTAGSAVITFWTLGGGAAAAAPSGNQTVNFWVVNY